MVELRVGAGGWAYFRVPGQDSLKAYSSVYDFVEVNSTYYEYPDLRRVSAWRKRVPEGFMFSVRCHRDLATSLASNAGPSVVEIAERMARVVKILRASVLAVLIPRNIRLSESELSSRLGEAISTFHAGGTRIAVELRGGSSRKVLKALEKNDAVHCVDISREQPGYESDMLYTRLFGKGQENIYEFDDEEIREIKERASAPRFEKSILAFHGVRMYRDAGRLKAFLNSGKFPQITGQTGLDSLKEVLKEDASFPTTREELILRQGWKLFDMAGNERMRVSRVLQNLPAGSYETLDDVIDALETHPRWEAHAVGTAHARTRRGT